MTMAELIAKVASASQKASAGPSKFWPSTGSSVSYGTTEAKAWAGVDEKGDDTDLEVSSSDKSVELEDPGIRKTVSTKVSFNTRWRHAGEEV